MLSKEVGKLFFIGASLFVVVGMFVGIGGEPNETTDDSSAVPEILRNGWGQGVLGKDSEDVEAGCPKSAPIIGWIDFSGEKLIVDYLPEGQNPSACFASIQAANLEGYYEEE